MSTDPPETPEILAWHFLKADHRTGEGDILVTPGQTLAVEPPLALCCRGLHASRRAIDALAYAPGPVVQRVRLSGVIVEGADKLCASRRECLWVADATTALHLFACDVATTALEAERAAGREPDSRSWEAVRVKRAWLAGEATDAARAAAWAAAWAAAGAAAGAAARAAARDAAWDAAWDAQNTRLESALAALSPDAVTSTPNP